MVMMRVIRVIVVLVIINKPQVFASFLVDYNGAIIIWSEDDKRREKHNSGVCSNAGYSHLIRLLFGFLCGRVVWERPAKLYSLEIVYNSINKYQLSGNKSPSILPINYPCGIIYCKLHFQRIANHVSSYYTCTQTHMGTCQSVDCNSFLTSLWSRRTTIMILVCKQRNGDFRKFCEHLRLIYPSPGFLATGLAFPSRAPLYFVGGCSYWF